MISKVEFLEMYNEFPLNHILMEMTEEQIEELYQKVKDEFE